MKRNPVLDAEFFYGTTAEIMFRASQLRKNMTKAEKLLWNALHKKKIGFTFRRQHPINLFIADFYCHKAMVAIEVDGSIHDIEYYKERDKGRDDEFAKFGIRTLRFTNEEIMENLDIVVATIKIECQNRLPLTASPKLPLPASPNGEESELEKI